MKPRTTEGARTAAEYAAQTTAAPTTTAGARAMASRRRWTLAGAAGALTGAALALASSLDARPCPTPVQSDASSSPTAQDTETPKVEASAPARLELPPGPVSDVLAGVTADLLPAATPRDLGGPREVPAIAADAWRDAATWAAWAELVAAERAEFLASTSGAGAPAGSAASGERAAAGTTPEAAFARAQRRAERRARLALFALEHGRSDDAWEHLAATTPEWTAALLPRFLPGVPPHAPSGRGGSAGALAADVVLAPALPPPSRERVAGRVDRRSMTTRDVRIGESTVSMRVAVEAEGVQIDVRHVAGPPARFAVRIPRSPDYAYGDEYVDWYRQETQGVPHALTVKPGEEEHTLYARFDVRRETSAAGLPRTLPAGLARGGLWLLVPDGGPDRALIEAAARAISATGLGFTCGVRVGGVPSSGLSGTTVDLGDAATRADKLAWLASAVEHFALTR